MLQSNRNCSVRNTRWIRLFLALVVCTVSFTFQDARVEAAPEEMVVESTSSAVGESVSTLSWSHAAGSGVNRILIVSVSFRAADKSSISSITYGGNDLTLIGTARSPDKKQKYRVSMYYLIAPGTGSADVVITFSGDAVLVVAGAISVTHVDQTDPYRAFAWAADKSTSPSVSIESADGEIVVDTLGTKEKASPATVGSGQTERWNAYTDTSDKHDTLGAGSTGPGASSVTMSWTLGVAQDWVIGAVSLRHNDDATAVTLASFAARSGLSAAASQGALHFWPWIGLAVLAMGGLIWMKRHWLDLV